MKVVATAVLTSLAVLGCDGVASVESERIPVRIDPTLESSDAMHALASEESETGEPFFRALRRPDGDIQMCVLYPLGDSFYEQVYFNFRDDPDPFITDVRVVWSHDSDMPPADSLDDIKVNASTNVLPIPNGKVDRLLMFSLDGKRQNGSAHSVTAKLLLTPAELGTRIDKMGRKLDPDKASHK
jgi:hypothetical protein